MRTMPIRPLLLLCVATACDPAVTEVLVGEDAAPVGMRPAEERTVEEDRAANQAPWAFGSCGHPDVGADVEDTVLDRGAEGWPAGVSEEADGTIRTPFTTIRPIDYAGDLDTDGMAHVSEYCARRTNFYRAFEGLEPYGRYIEQEPVSVEDAQECQREGTSCRHRTSRAGPDSQNAIRGEDGGPTSVEWLAHQNFVLEAGDQGGHYGAQTRTEPRLLACVQYRQDGGEITFQNFWDAPPPGRFQGIPDPDYFLDTERQADGTLRASAVAVGGRHTCALLTDGTVRCWGDGVWGQLGEGTFEEPEGEPWAMWMHGRNLPGLPVPLAEPATRIIAGHDHSCALLESGQVQCWGHDDRAQLGLGAHRGAGPARHEETKVFRPESVSNIPEDDPVVDLSAAMRGTCLEFRSGRVTCFGWSINGATSRPPHNGSNCWAQFATGNDGEEATRLRGLSQLHLGSAHGCGLTAEGGLRCWGRDYRGQLGDGARETNFMASSEDCAGTQVEDWPEIPRDVVGLRGGVAQVRAGAEHTCAILDNGRVRCWGSNRHGQLGFAADYPVPEGAEEHERAPELEATPVDVCLERPALDLALGGAHTCALLDDGTVWCWGSANHGKLGNGHYLRDRTAPSPVQGLSDVVDIESRHMHTCALTGSGQLYCWGLNYNGQLGIGNAVDQAVPQLVAGF